jgi:hypothetical protein
MKVKLKTYFCGMSEDFSGFSSRKKMDPEDFYTSPEGYIVFTEKYHLKRGHCCKSGCKHCPYGFDKKTGVVKGIKKT